MSNWSNLNKAIIVSKKVTPTESEKIQSNQRIPSPYLNFINKKTETYFLGWQEEKKPILGEYLFFPLKMAPAFSKKAPLANVYAQVSRVISKEELGSTEIISSEDPFFDIEHGARVFSCYIEARVFGCYSVSSKNIELPDVSLIGLEGFPINKIMFEEFLYMYLKQICLEFPLYVVNSIVYSSVYGSSFCQKGYSTLLEQYIPQIFKEINRYYGEKQGKDIYELFVQFSDFPFTQYRNTMIDELLVKFVRWLASYSTLVNFFSNIVFYIEEKLMEITDFAGKTASKAGTIDDKVRLIIDVNLIDLVIFNEKSVTSSEKEPRFVEFELKITPPPHQMSSKSTSEAIPTRESLKSSEVKEERSSSRQSSLDQHFSMSPHDSKKPAVDISTVQKGSESITFKLPEQEPSYSQDRMLELEKAMIEAADRKEYEKAAAIRDEILTLRRTSLEEFALDTKKHKTGIPPIFVPFRVYYPSYRDMTRRQKDWYFYWRKNVRKGEYIRTDLSYVLVYLYEVINDRDIVNAEDGYGQLLNIWINYRIKFPELDRYLPKWVMEYLYIKDSSIQVMASFFENAVTLLSDRKHKGLINYLSNLIYSKYYHLNIAEIPIHLIYHLIDYQKQFATKREKDRKEIDLDKHLINVLRLLEDYHKENYGQGLLEYFKPISFKKLPFDRARYFKKIKIEVYPYTRTKIYLYDLLTNLIKEILNRLRKIHKIKGKFKVKIRDPNVQALIDYYWVETFGEDYLGQISPKHSKMYLIVKSGKFKLDREKVKALEKESEEIEELLSTTEVDTVITSNDLKDEEISLQLEDPTLKPLDASTVTNDQNVIMINGLDEEWNAFKENLIDYQIETISVVLKSSNTRKKIEEIAETNALMPEALIESINELAIETIGDIVIEDYNIVEEYMKEIRILLNTQ